MFAYVGSRTTRERNARGDGITVYRVEDATGSLTPVQVVGDLVNPSYLTLSHDRLHLYAVHGDQREISAFSVDSETGRLTFLNRQDTGGKNPVHLAIEPHGRFIVVCNHIGASLAVLPLAADGSLEPRVQLVEITGEPGPHRIEQPHAKPHFCPFDPAGQYVVVPDKGLDQVFSYRFADGRLAPAAQPAVPTREAAGPRHVAFHPNAPFAYVVNELDSTVTAYRYDPQTGALSPLQILSALPDTFVGNSRAAGIVIDPAGRHLYASNRGDDSLAVFRIAPDSGRLTLTSVTHTEGRTPRFFTFSPDGHLLFALNEDSDSIVTFIVDPETGGLRPAGREVRTGSPVCMIFS